MNIPEQCGRNLTKVPPSWLVRSVFSCYNIHKVGICSPSGLFPARWEANINRRIVSLEG